MRMVVVKWKLGSYNFGMQVVWIVVVVVGSRFDRLE